MRQRLLAETCHRRARPATLSRRAKGRPTIAVPHQASQRLTNRVTAVKTGGPSARPVVLVCTARGRAILYRAFLPLGSGASGLLSAIRAFGYATIQDEGSPKRLLLSPVASGDCLATLTSLRRRVI